MTGPVVAGDRGSRVPGAAGVTALREDIHDGTAHHVVMADPEDKEFCGL